MAIRQKYQVGGVAAVAAYAAGANQARERRKKQMLDLYRDERRMQPRRLKYQAALGRARQQQRAGDQIVGREVVDPLTGLDLDTPEGKREARMIRARRRRNERARRQGKAPKYPGAEVGLTPGQTRDERERGQELEDEKRERGQELEDEKRQHQWDVEKGTAEQRRENDEARVTGLDPVPEWADPKDRQFLTKLATGISELLYSNKHDLNDPATRKAFNEAIAVYNRVRGQLIEPSPADEARRGLFYRDDATGELYDKPGPGRTAYREGESEPAFAPPPEQKAAEVEAEKARKAAEKRLEGIAKGARARVTPLFVEDNPRKSREELYQMAWDLEEPLWPEGGGRGQMGGGGPSGSDYRQGLPPGAVDLGNGVAEYKGEIYTKMQPQGGGQQPPAGTGLSQGGQSQPAMPGEGEESAWPGLGRRQRNPTEESGGTQGGQQQPTGLERLIDAARAGNQKVQQALTQRGVQWQL